MNNRGVVSFRDQMLAETIERWDRSWRNLQRRFPLTLSLILALELFERRRQLEMGRKHSRSEFDGLMQRTHRPIRIASGSQASPKQVEHARGMRIELGRGLISLSRTGILVTHIEPGAKLGKDLGIRMTAKCGFQRPGSDAVGAGERPQNQIGCDRYRTVGQSRMLGHRKV